MVEPGEKVMSLSHYEMNVFMKSNHFVISTPEILPNDTAILAKFTELEKKHGSSSPREYRKQSFFVVLDIGWPPNGMTDLQFRIDLIDKYDIAMSRGNRLSTIGTLPIHTWEIETPPDHSRHLDRYFVIGTLGRDVKIPLPSTIESILRELLGMHSSTGVPQPESRSQDERGSRRNGLTRWLEHTPGSPQPESRSQDRWLEHTPGSPQPLHTPERPRPTSQPSPYNPEDPPGMKWDWMHREWVDETAPRRGFI
jgi:hypothetical protein